MSDVFFFKDLFIFIGKAEDRGAWFLESIIYFLNWKVRYTKRRRDREEDLPSIDSFSKWPQRPELS